MYVRDKTRLGRWSNPKRHAHFEIEFADAGAPIRYSQMEHQPLDTDDDLEPGDMATMLMDFVENIMSSSERTTTRWRTVEGIRNRLRLGCYPGPRAPYGYARWLFHFESKTFLEEIRPGAPSHRAGCAVRLRPATDGSFEWVRAIFERADAGHSFRAIAAWLHERGAASPSGRGKWAGGEVRRILMSRIYIGELVWGKYKNMEPVELAAVDSRTNRPIVFRGFLDETPVEREVFARVEERIARQRREHMGLRQGASPHLLSGLLRCARCGAPVCGSRYSQRRGRTLRTGVFYRHATSEPATHPARANCVDRCGTVSSGRVEKAILVAVREALADADLLAATERELDLRIRAVESDAAGAAVRRLRIQVDRDRLAMRQAATSAARAANAAAALVHQETVDRIGAVVEQTEARIRELDAERQRLVGARQRVLEAVRPTADSVAVAFAVGTVQEQRALLYALLNGARVDFTAQSLEVHLKMG